MFDASQFIKIIQTESGNAYVYLTRDNRIIGLDKAWYEKIPAEQKDKAILQVLEENNIQTKIPPKKFGFNFSRDELYYNIDHCVETLTLEVTQQCSLRCTYCIYSGNYKHERVHNSASMNCDMMKKCIDYYYDHSTEAKTGNISFYGGESLLCLKEIQFAIEYARNKWGKKPITFQISTNGTTLTESVIQWIDAQPDVSILMTCNGPMQDRYRVFPDGQGSLTTIMTAVRRIRESFPKLWKRTNFLANVASRRELLDLRDFYISEIGKPPLGITGIKAEQGNDTIHQIVQTKDIVEDKEQVLRLFCKDDPYIRLYYNVDGVCIRYIGEETPVIFRTSFCKVMSHSLFISAEGKIRPCEQICSDLDFGDVDQGWSRKKVSAILNTVQEVFEQRCVKCWARRLCNVCFSSINEDDRGNLLFPETSCKEMQHRAAVALKVFCEMRERNPELIKKIREKYKIN